MLTRRCSFQTREDATKWLCSCDAARDARHPLAVNLQHHVDCRPCGKSVCPLQHQRCMSEHTVDRVYAAVRQQLGRTASIVTTRESIVALRK